MSIQYAPRKHLGPYSDEVKKLKGVKGTPEEVEKIYSERSALITEIFMNREEGVNYIANAPKPITEVGLPGITTQDTAYVPERMFYSSQLPLVQLAVYLGLDDYTELPSAEGFWKLTQDKLEQAILQRLDFDEHSVAAVKAYLLKSKGFEFSDKHLL